MEPDNSLFSRTAIDGHAFKFDWTFDLPVFEDIFDQYDRKVCSPNYQHDHTYLSPEFSLSKTCHVLLQLICQEMYKSYSSRNFKIGLQRNGETLCAIDGFCSVNISISNKEISQKGSFEFNQLHKGNKCFTQELTLTPLYDNRVVQCYQRSRHSGVRDKAVWITGTILVQNCCKTKRIINEALNKNFIQLQQDFETFFKAKRITDVTLNIGNELLQAHKFVLSARSPVFQRMFSQDCVEGNQNNVRIDDIEKKVMEVFLSFLYTGVIEEREFSTVFELYSVADKYEVTTLFETCRHILTSLISIHTVTPVLKLADMHSDGELKEIAVKYICDNFSKVETTAEWGDLLDKHPRLASYTLRRVSTNIAK